MKVKDLQMTKSEKYMRGLVWQPTTIDELKNLAKKTGKELVKANLKMVQNGTMTKDEALGEISRLEEAINKI